MSAAIEIARLDLEADDLRRCARRANGAEAAQRMLAIALVLDGRSRAEAARSCGMDRQTLCDWVHRYNERGLDGLDNLKPSGRPPMLDTGRQATVAAWVREGPDLAEDGVVRWRRKDLAARIERRFGVSMSERGVGEMLKRLGFRRLSVRPQHPEQDEESLQAHKKTSRPRSPVRSPTTLEASRSNSGGRTRPASDNRAP